MRQREQIWEQFSEHQISILEQKNFHLEQLTTLDLRSLKNQICSNSGKSTIFNQFGVLTILKQPLEKDFFQLSMLRYELNYLLTSFNFIEAVCIDNKESGENH